MNLCVSTTPFRFDSVENLVSLYTDFAIDGCRQAISRVFLPQKFPAARGLIPYLVFYLPSSFLVPI